MYETTRKMDMGEVLVQKFNPNHDPHTGEFTAGNASSAKEHNSAWHSHLESQRQSEAAGDSKLAELHKKAAIAHEQAEKAKLEVAQHGNVNFDLNEKAYQLSKAANALSVKSRGGITLPEDVGKAARVLKLPGGKGANMYEDTYRWSKYGGYADKQMLAVHAAAKAAGFEEAESSSHGNPDGSYVGHGQLFTKSGWELRTRSTFGPVAADNHHSVELKKVKV